MEKIYLNFTELITSQTYQVMFINYFVFLLVDLTFSYEVYNNFLVTCLLLLS